MEPQDALTVVLERFARANPELTNGFAEHAPMGAEALLTLGVTPSAVVAWAAQHQPTTLPASSPLAILRDDIERELADEPTHRRCGEPARHAADLTSSQDPAAIASLSQRWDAHPAKLVEAALRGHTLTGDVVFLQAAAAMLAG